MGIGSIGVPGLILIIVIALIIFGPSKLPELGKAAGRTIKEFKDSVNGLMDDKEDKKIENKKDESAKEESSKVE